MILCLSEEMCHTAPRTGADSLLHSVPGALTPPPTTTDIPNAETFLDCLWKAVDNWSFYKTEAKKTPTKCEKLQVTLLSVVLL